MTTPGLPEAENPRLPEGHDYEYDEADGDYGYDEAHDFGAR
jgi:hypothetical protein